MIVILILGGGESIRYKPNVYDYLEKTFRFTKWNDCAGLLKGADSGDEKKNQLIYNVFN